MNSYDTPYQYTLLRCSDPILANGILPCSRGFRSLGFGAFGLGRQLGFDYH